MLVWQRFEGMALAGFDSFTPVLGVKVLGVKAGFDSARLTCVKDVFRLRTVSSPAAAARGVRRVDHVKLRQSEAIGGASEAIGGNQRQSATLGGGSELLFNNYLFRALWVVPHIGSMLKLPPPRSKAGI